VSPQQLQQQYGITDARSGQIATPGGPLRGTFVPVTLRDGTKAELLIPDSQANEPHPMYMQDESGIHPVELQDNVSREQLVTPAVVERRAERPHAHRRSWEKEALIIGGGAGGGALVGALAGGKKGAAIGAGAGGVGGLIYDLATRKKR